MQESLNLVLSLIPFFLAKNLDSVFSANEVSSDRSLFVWLQLGVTVHEFMLISICQCLCHIMIVSWSHGFMCFVVSMDTWFHRFRGFNGFIVSCVSWFHRFRGVKSFMIS